MYQSKLTHLHKHYVLIFNLLSGLYVDGALVDSPSGFTFILVSRNLLADLPPFSRGWEVREKSYKRSNAVRATFNISPFTNESSNDS